jgi:hypothetical protein
VTFPTLPTLPTSASAPSETWLGEYGVEKIGCGLDVQWFLAQPVADARFLSPLDVLEWRGQ